MRRDMEWSLSLLLDCLASNYFWVWDDTITILYLDFLFFNFEPGWLGRRLYCFTLVRVSAVFGADIRSISLTFLFRGFEPGWDGLGRLGRLGGILRFHIGRWSHFISSVEIDTSLIVSRVFCMASSDFSLLMMGMGFVGLWVGIQG